MIRGNDPILLTPGPLTTSLETEGMQDTPHRAMPSAPLSKIWSACSAESSLLKK